MAPTSSDKTVIRPFRRIRRPGGILPGMTKTELMPLLESLGLHPSRRLGQNFLVDPNLLASLVRDAAPQAGETILEIGPGPGILTRPLLAAGVKLTSIELDHRFATYLRDALANQTSFRLIEADACDLDFDALMGPGPYRCIANLPYAISTTVLTRLAAAVNPPTACFVLLQKEMADRLAAKPGTKAYGAPTVQLQLLYAVQIRRRVSPAVFFPPPEVESAFVQFTRRPDAPPLALRHCCRDLARLGFGQRRKQFAKLLATRFPAAAVAAAIKAAGGTPETRAEALSPAQFVRLAEALA